MQIYVHRNNQQLGPFTEAEIRAQLAAGTITLQDHVWWQGQASWLPLGQTSLVTPIAPPTPGMPPIPPVQPIPPTGAFPQTVQTSQLAVWSLVCACVSVICGIFTLIPALVLGHMSLAEIKKHPGMQGRGLAIAGLAISYGFLALTVLVIGAIVVFGALGSNNNVQDIFKTITSQLNAAQASSSSDDSTTNSDSTTNAPDSSTNTPTATPATNSADQSTNSAAATPTNQ